ncbi:hypothetical protein Tco_1464751 [Tanacetum coccineum]
MNSNHKISLARFRINELGDVINDMNVRHQADIENLMDSIIELKNQCDTDGPDGSGPVDQRVVDENEAGGLSGQMGHDDEIVLAHVRTSTLEILIEDI